MSNGSSSTTQGLYSLTREGLPIPRHIAYIGSEMYRDAYLLGWQAYALEHHDRKNGGRKISERKLAEAALKKSTKEDAPGYDDHRDRFRHAYNEAYYAGWEASAVKYWLVELREPKKRRRQPAAVGKNKKPVVAPGLNRLKVPQKSNRAKGEKPVARN